MAIVIRIRKHERGLHLRYGDFRGFLQPGRHFMPSRFWSARRDVVQIASTLDTRLTHELLDTIVRHPAAQEELNIVELNDTQRAIVWRQDRLFAILGPGRHALWRTPYDLRVETFNVGDGRFAHPRLPAILQLPGSTAHLECFPIEAGWEGLLFRDGKLVERLSEGLHVFWKGAGQLACKMIDRREQVADVAGQEIMTRDKVTLRVNLVVTYRVTDPVAAITAVSDHSQALYREAQLALRAAVGTRPLDELLRDKESIGGEVRASLSPRADGFGVKIVSVGLRDIVLPGDMKTILNQVITAEKQAEANLIKRREETAAARSQANTARLLAESPVLARMKELELLQEILAGAKATFVFGQGNLAEQIRGLVASTPTDGA